MSHPNVTLEDYRGVYGEIAEGDFDAALPAAEGTVADLVGLNRVELPFEIAAWKRAVLAVVAVDAAYGFSHGVGEGMASVTLGKFSASGGCSAPGGSQWLSDARAAARRELAGTGLLYAGVPL
ncbi:hypothetical protein [Adlercreutzia muris]|uniref:hypothetical protein n=1 Tax=Adlercreutzia muris TaxID=1796610 RepID=UPI00351591BC